MFLFEFSQSCFWDVNFNKLDIQEYPYFAIERILEYGREKGANCLEKNFNRESFELFCREYKG